MIVVFQSLSPFCDPMNCSTPGFPVLHYLPVCSNSSNHRVSVMPSNHLILCHPFPSCPQSFPASRLALPIRWSKYWSFSFRISSSNEYSELISFRIDSFDLLAVQGTVKSLLQHYSLKASILRRLAFFIVQFSHPYIHCKNHSFECMDICQ